MAKSKAQQEREKTPPAAPAPLPVPVPDNHTHLDIVIEWLGGTPSEHLDRAEQVGIDRIVQVGTDVQSSRWAAQLAADDHRVLAAVALHPNDAARNTDGLDDALAVIDELAAQPRVRAIGETGLDFYRTREEDGIARQRESFARHIDIAKRHGIALMIHDRDAHDAVFDVLAAEGAPETVVFHCFSGDAQMARRCADAGWFMSFAGNTTFNASAGLREAYGVAPRELLLVETDAPFLTPMPHRGRPNGSYLTPLTIGRMAAERDEDLAELCQALADNTERVYGAW
ncbi:TatD family hydrolase [Blastococcus sp. Marseille-P5729]|uniref:TatD family hydrolase n=1 Tax=Blastococcus sp. Marseille-P5729 TaxID=2086582 RepID=UPI000D113B30|nr:TatD family hydrolase [Blastococcus sp. Marseille-P5729]